MELDALDAGLLAELRRDARQSYRALARRLSVTTPTVSARVARLERMGLLRGYTAVVNAEAVQGASSLLLVQAAPRSAAGLAAALASMPEVTSVYALADGRVAAVATFTSLQEERELLERLGARLDVASLDPVRVLSAAKEEPRARFGPRVRVALPCDQCHKVIEGAAVQRKLDGREHWFCCATCEATFLRRYEKARAAAPAARPKPVSPPEAR